MDFALPAPDTLPYLFLCFTAISGELPAALIYNLPGGKAYMDNVVKLLKRGGLIRSYYRDGLRGYRLTAAAKKLLLDDQPEQFHLYLTGSTDTNILKSEVPRRLRLHRMAEVLVAMYNAGFSVFHSEKPYVFGPTPPPPGQRIQWPAYYSSRELKEMGEITIKVRGSRATGVLLSDDCIYTVYNVGPSQVKWEFRAEMRLKALLHTELRQRRMPGQYHSAPIHGLVFGQGMEPLLPLLTDTADSGHNFLVADGDYDHFYYVPSDYRSELVLQLLCDHGKSNMLEGILSENLCAGDPGLLIENDRLDEAGDPVLFGYTCDMPRIRRFNTALTLQERKGTLICFDFQEETLRRACGQGVEIQSLDFDRVKALFEL